MIDREPRSGETLPDGFLLSVVYLSTRDECSNDRSERERRPLAASVLLLLTDVLWYQYVTNQMKLTPRSPWVSRKTCSAGVFLVSTGRLELSDRQRAELRAWGDARGTAEEILPAIR